MSAQIQNFGIVAEFADPEELLRAAAQVHAQGYRRVEAYSPMPVEGLSEAIGFPRSRMPLVVLIGGLIGCLSGIALQYFVTFDYPMNIGGKPLNSWPAFVPVVFEMTILVAALFAVLGMLAMNGLPRPHHPLFGIQQFGRATQDRFFLIVLSDDPMYDEEGTRQFMKGLGALEVIDVPA